MLNVKQSFELAKKTVKDLSLKSILDFGEYYGFLFGSDKDEFVFGSSYILVNKKTKEICMLPTTPNNAQKINSARKISLTIIR